MEANKKQTHSTWQKNNQKTYEHEERKVEYGNIVEGNFLLLPARCPPNVLYSVH